MYTHFIINPPPHPRFSGSTLYLLGTIVSLYQDYQVDENFSSKFLYILNIRVENFARFMYNDHHIQIVSVPMLSHINATTLIILTLNLDSDKFQYYASITGDKIDSVDCT